MNRQRLTCLLGIYLTIFALAAGLHSQDPSHINSQKVQQLTAQVDPRVELLSIVFRLAGNREYRQGKIPAYTAAVEAHFSAHRDHAAIKAAAQLRHKFGISYDAVMSLAIHIDSIDSLQARTSFQSASSLDKRWQGQQADEFLQHLRSFVKVSKFHQFWQSQQALYSQTELRANKVISTQSQLGWFEKFFGARPAARFSLYLGMLNGGACYGPSYLSDNNREDLYCILGVWLVDQDGEPRFDNSVLPTVAHEFCHSFVNPVVDAHAKALQPIAEPLFAQLESAMRNQAYGHWKTMMVESLVRAATVRYVHDTKGPIAAAVENKAQKKLSFFWTPELSKELARFQSNKKKYPDLHSFMPEIIHFFAQKAPKILKKHQQELATDRPQVVRISPKNGATSVDAKTTTIVVEFDRPMMPGSWSVVGGGSHFPEINGNLSYNSERTILSIPVKLKPSWSYQFGLNNQRFQGFKAADGSVLQPVLIRFSTGKQD